jgi:hypothetical protein
VAQHGAVLASIKARRLTSSRGLLYLHTNKRLTAHLRIAARFAAM